MIQRKWRRSYGCMMWTAEPDSQVSRRATSRHGLRTKTVEAPSFFGEACLWEPLEDWGTAKPFTFQYSLVCTSKSELVCINRAVLKDIVGRHSPWLRTRLEHFRQDVLRYDRMGPESGRGQLDGPCNTSAQEATEQQAESIGSRAGSAMRARLPASGGPSSSGSLKMPLLQR
uniref:Cyclic nucleotide-binding domain-containing protein n=1 Tax=Alexandrium catenella TaxID=2925 RepID=A0A7S1SFD4_ALECA